MRDTIIGVLPPALVEEAVRRALAEDLGLAGDLTSQATIPVDAVATATLSAREAGVIAGLPLALEVFRQLGGAVSFDPQVSDGAAVTKGDIVAVVAGDARQLLAGERTALNFLNHLSGIAAHTHKFVEAVAGTGARICDTRKTTPGLRAFEKYAVRCGGGWNHRYALDDAVLIKDNHIAVAGGAGKAYRAARQAAGHLVAIEIEVTSLDELSEVLDAGATIVMLDNMDNQLLRAAVKLNDGRARLEASGGVTLERVRGIAETGVDYISSSQITMGARPLDLGLDVEIQ
ncbi:MULTISPECIES: carboxylating nicotinate-nucleotide diphosphorylase [unclassified Devosia]|uniref:carboxylating nicotinate-nucleotide diphosphorylase n=1 Tax=unclassified Devosia TaxID=196773 RepID=UPI00095962A7|nr:MULTISPECIES: carboxylating nicotinate-nucleotide diphosphorylase [unclassified Devosia]MBN9360227.1 carboxylating nicotinate-nucleotide diphosphorylase [Devosia sp.]OJX22266.1 MAG: nicotinate-nucleotide diphosphorylase (carboxylating) [Devosia sp. 66-14]